MQIRLEDNKHKQMTLYTNKRVQIIKALVFSFVFLGINAFTIAQVKDRDIINGDKYFAIDDYYLANEYYEKALENKIDTIYVHYQLGECKRYFFEYQEAEMHYQIAADNAIDKFPLARHYYAGMLKVNGKYEEAIVEYDKFLKEYTKDDLYRRTSKIDKEGTVFILNELEMTVRDYGFHNLGSVVNTTESDFSPSIYNNDSILVISSARIDNRRTEIYAGLGGAYLDNYMFQKGEAWEDISGTENFSGLNTQYHDGAGTFSKDKNTFLFTRCDEIASDGKTFHCVIYVSEKVKDKWKNPVKLNTNINPKDTWNAQPSLSNNGDTLFFASKRAGGLGQTDIWYSVKNSGSDYVKGWGAAVNIGAPINTEFVDMSPQYNTDKDVLLFASEGHVGLGGLDIYAASKEGNEFKKIKNLGLPFNSNKDDFHMVLGEEVGYLSSNRDGGIGNDDVYGFNIYARQAEVADLSQIDNEFGTIAVYGKLEGVGGAKKGGVEVLVEDENLDVIAKTTTNDKGEFNIKNIELDGKEEILIELPRVHLLSDYNYRVDSLSFIATSSEVLVYSDDTLGIDVGGQIVSNDQKPVPHEEIYLLDENHNEIMRISTDEDGQFMFRNLDGMTKYYILSKEEHSVINLQIFKHEVELNTVSIDDAEKGLSSRIQTESIYFDYDASKVRKEAKNALKTISKVLKSHSHVTLELHGYTDSDGSEDYNKALGKRRADEALRYLKKQGIDESRVQIIAFGEVDPLASNETETGKQLNRRVDFYLLGGAQYVQEATVHVLEVGMTLKDVAEKYNMTLKELKELNGLTSNEVEAFTPLRVRHVEGIGISSARTFNHDAAHQVSNNASIHDRKFLTKNDAYHKNVKYWAEDDKGFALVLPNNTLYTIAQIHNVSVSRIKKWNELKSNKIYFGQILQVTQTPSVGRKEYLENHVSILPDAGVKISDYTGEVFEIDGISRYVVKEGDSFGGISERFGMSFEQLRSINQLKDYQLMSGMVLIVRK